MLNFVFYYSLKQAAEDHKITKSIALQITTV